MKGRRIVLALLWVLSLVLISFYGGSISYGIFFAITLLPIVSIVYLSVAYFCFSIYQEVGSRNMVCKQPMPYYYVLENSSRFAIAGVSVRLFAGLSQVEDVSDETEVELLPGDRQEFHTKLLCYYRGEYEVGVKEIVLTDFFGILRFRYKNPGTIKAIVKPRSIFVPELGAIADIDIKAASQSRKGDEENDATVRDYVPGDALKRIHPMASAKTGVLKTRNRVGEEKCGIGILYDGKRYYREPEQYLREENQIVELTLAVSYFFAGHNVAFEVYDSRSVEQATLVQGIKGYEALYEKMACEMFSEEIDVLDCIRNGLAERRFNHLGILILVVHEVSEEFFTAVNELTENGTTILIYWVTDDAKAEYRKKSNDRCRIQVISTDAVLEEAL